MGDPKLPRRSYDTPSHPWEGERIKAEHETVKQFGLKNKRELWKAQSMLRNLRGQSRDLQARLRYGDAQAQVEKENLLRRCGRLGLLPMDGGNLDDVLVLNQEAILGRRLQTLVWQKGLANTQNQARQLIVHGHISVGGRKVTIPGYMVTRAEEAKIEYNPHSPYADDLHPMRAQREEAGTKRIPQAEEAPKPKKKLKKEVLVEAVDEGVSLPEEVEP